MTAGATTGRVHTAITTMTVVMIGAPGMVTAGRMVTAVVATRVAAAMATVMADTTIAGGTTAAMVTIVGTSGTGIIVMIAAATAPTTGIATDTVAVPVIVAGTAPTVAAASMTVDRVRIVGISAETIGVRMTGAVKTGIRARTAGSSVVMTGVDSAGTTTADIHGAMIAATTAVMTGMGMAVPMVAGMTTTSVVMTVGISAATIVTTIAGPAATARVAGIETTIGAATTASTAMVTTGTSAATTGATTVAATVAMIGETIAATTAGASISGTATRDMTRPAAIRTEPSPIPRRIRIRTDVRASRKCPRALSGPCSPRMNVSVCAV